MVPKLDKDGYLVFCMCVRGIRIYMSAHRLVALAYIQNPDNLPQVNHLDGNKLNNHQSNLQWCSVAENNQHAYDSCHKIVWNKGKTGIWSDEQIKKIRTQGPLLVIYKNGRREKHDSIRELVRSTGFDRRTVMRILKKQDGYNSIKGASIEYA